MTGRVCGKMTVPGPSLRRLQGQCADTNAPGIAFPLLRLYTHFRRRRPVRTGSMQAIQFKAHTLSDLPRSQNAAYRPNRRALVSAQPIAKMTPTGNRRNFASPWRGHAKRTFSVIVLRSSAADRHAPCLICFTTLKIT